MRKKIKTAADTWRTTLKLCKKNPVILLPFVIVALLDTLLLCLLYLAPRPPLSALFAPPIKAFWGERFLHYPLNLLLLPRLFDHGRVISTALTGVLMTGAAIGMLKDAGGGAKPRFLFNLIKSLRMYPRLLAIWLIMFCLISAAFKGLPVIFHLKQGAAPQIAFYAAFLVNIILEAIFIYALPAAIIEDKKIWPAVKRGVSFSKSVFLPTLILISAPTLAYIPMVILRGKLPMLMSKVFPEIILIFLGIGIVISALTDWLITSAAAVLFLGKREGK